MILQGQICPPVQKVAHSAGGKGERAAGVWTRAKTKGLRLPSIVDEAPRRRAPECDALLPCPSLPKQGRGGSAAGTVQERQQAGERLRATGSGRKECLRENGRWGAAAAAALAGMILAVFLLVNGVFCFSNLATKSRPKVKWVWRF